MRRWIISVLFSMLLSYPAVSGAADDTLSPGKSTLFNYPLIKIPIGAKSDSSSVGEKKGEGEAKNDEKKENEALDKKVDDAIKKAWEEK